MLNIRPEVIQPPQAATLSASLKSYNYKQTMSQKNWIKIRIIHKKEFEIAIYTDLLRESDPVAAGAVLLDVGLESGVLLRRPGAFLHVGFITARSSPHLSNFAFALLALLISLTSAAVLSLIRVKDWRERG